MHTVSCGPTGIKSVFLPSYIFLFIFNNITEPLKMQDYAESWLFFIEGWLFLAGWQGSLKNRRLACFSLAGELFLPCSIIDVK